MRPATGAAPTESTPSTTKSAINPPIGKPSTTATGQSQPGCWPRPSHVQRAVLVRLSSISMSVPPCGAFGLATHVEPFSAVSGGHEKRAKRATYFRRRPHTAARPRPRIVDGEPRCPAALVLLRDAAALGLELPHRSHVAETVHVTTIEPCATRIGFGSSSSRRTGTRGRGGFSRQRWLGNRPPDQDQAHHDGEGTQAPRGHARPPRGYEGKA